MSTVVWLFWLDFLEKNIKKERKEVGEATSPSSFKVLYQHRSKKIPPLYLAVRILAAIPSSQNLLRHILVTALFSCYERGRVISSHFLGFLNRHFHWTSQKQLACLLNPLGCKRSDIPTH